MKIGTTSPNHPFAAFQLLRSNQDPLSTLFAYATAWELNLVAENQAEIADAQLVSGGFCRPRRVSGGRTPDRRTTTIAAGRRPWPCSVTGTGRTALPRTRAPSDGRS